MKLVKQKVLGIALLLVSLFAVLLAIFSESPEDKDCTMVLILIPMGIWLLTSRQNLSEPPKN